jgi:hypothetical protein
MFLDKTECLPRTFAGSRRCSFKQRESAPRAFLGDHLEVAVRQQSLFGLLPRHISDFEWFFDVAGISCGGLPSTPGEPLIKIRYRVELSQEERNQLTTLLSWGKHPSRKLTGREEALLVANARSNPPAGQLGAMDAGFVGWRDC